MSNILSNIQAKRLFGKPNRNRERHSSGNARNQRNPAPVVVDIDDPATQSSYRDEDGQDNKRRRVLWPRKNAISLSNFSSLKTFCRRAYRKLGIKHCLSIALIVFYTIFGAGVFLMLEKENDRERLKGEYGGYLQEKTLLVKWLRANVPVIIRTANASHVTKLIEDRLEKYERRIGYSVQNETDWDFWSAMYFAGTIYTTIGYGDIYCRTTTGRLFTMVYSIIGIPLVLSVLTDLGCLLLKLLFNLTRVYNGCASFLAPLHPFGSRNPPKEHISNSSMDNKLQMSNMRHNDYVKTRDGMVEFGDKDERGDEDSEDLVALERREDEEYEYQLMRVPVLTALTATIGWIFLCAGLYCVWEDWSYFTSIYFFFISLSTIGLGDETPKRKDIVVATYALVIVGLSLVSMCLTVIQRRLEDLYLQLLRKILQEYHKHLSEGEDQMGATMGIMNFWQNNRAAKFLMPLLSKDKKQNVAQKFQDEAKAKGFQIPAVLRDLDPKSGLPAVLRVAKNKVIEGHAQLCEAVTDAIRRATDKARAKHEPDDDATLREIYSNHPEQEQPLQAAPQPHPEPPEPIPPPPPVAYDADTQTDEVELEDKQEQTIVALYVDAQTQSYDSALAADTKVDEATQVGELCTDSWAQCDPPEETAGKPISMSTDDEEVQTEMIQTEEAVVQTHKATMRDLIIQTHVIESAEVNCQTEHVETRNQRVQTPIPETLEQESQTDLLELPPIQSHSSSPHGWNKAKTNLQDIIKKAMSGMHSSATKSKMASAASTSTLDQQPEMASWNDVDGGNSSEEEDYDEDPDDLPNKQRLRRASRRVRGNLRWNPVDGLHAEKQRRVSDLKDIFETKWHKKS